MDYSDKLQKALDEFFNEIKQQADEAGYDLLTATDEDGKDIFVDLVCNYEGLPLLDIDCRWRTTRNDWIFDVSVSFPDVDLKKEEPETLQDILSSWEDVAKLADEIQSVAFAPDEWIED